MLGKSVENLARFLKKHQDVEQLGLKLLFTTLDLEKLKVKAMEEVRKNKDYIKQLIHLLKFAIQERDEARNQLEKLLNKTISLTILKGISDGLSRGKKPNEMENLELWKVNMRHLEASEVINKDIISHFVLCLVYCREGGLRKWFLSMETTLFRYRFQLETTGAEGVIGRV